MKPATLFASLFFAALLGAAAASPQSPAMAALRPPSLPMAVGQPHSRRTASTQLKHIVVIIQENRTLDNLLNGFCLPSGPCADTVLTDPVSGTPLTQYSLAAPFGIAHSHKNFVVQYDYGKMDGFTKTRPLCRHKSCPYSIFAYVPASETQIYRQLATVDGVLSDATFQTNQSPSFPAHLYAISGQSGGYDPDHLAIAGGSGACQYLKMDGQIDMTTPFPGTYGPKGPSCKDFPTIFDLLANAGHTWRYYADDYHSFFAPTQAIQHLNGSPNFIVPSTQFLSDVANGQLADVTFVVPWSGGVSDHPEMVHDPLAGPNWVASLVNAVGETPFWSDTAIVVWWDDWGGFFDHVAPPVPIGHPYWMGTPDPMEYGFRVPLILASPYARVGTIDHTPRTFVSALRLIEETFGLPSLGTTDQYEPDGLDSMLNFTQAPLPYTPLGGSRARPFKHLSH